MEEGETTDYDSGEFLKRVWDEMSHMRKSGVLSTDEEAVVDQWLVLCEIKAIIVTLYNVRYIQHMHRDVPPELYQAHIDAAEKVYKTEKPTEDVIDAACAAEKQAFRLPIDDIIDRWEALVEAFGGYESASELLFWEQFLGHRFP